MSANEKRVISGAARLAVTERGEGPPVVFLHAGVADRRSWRDTVDAIAPTHRAIAYDRHGFGDTVYEPEPHAHVDDLLAVLDALDVDRAALVGSSQGGAGTGREEDALCSLCCRPPSCILPPPGPRRGEGRAGGTSGKRVPCVLAASAGWFRRCERVPGSSLGTWLPQCDATRSGPVIPPQFATAAKTHGARVACVPRSAPRR